MKFSVLQSLPLALLLVALAPACHEDDGGGGPMPMVAVTQPAAEVSGDPGLAIEIRLVVTAGAGALTDLIAEAVFGAGGDIAIASGFDDAGGAEQVFTWDTSSAADGVYRVVAYSSAGGRTASAAAAGLVRLGQLAVPPGLVSEGGQGSVDPVALASAADASLVLLAQLGAGLPTVFGAGTSAEVVLDPVPSVADAVFARYAPDGSLLWVRRTRGTVPTSRSAGGPATLVVPKAVACAADGSAAVLVTLAGTATFADGEPAQQQVTSGSSDAPTLVELRLDADGATRWLRITEPVESNAEPVLALLPDGSSVVAGRIAGGAITEVTIGIGEPDETTITLAESAGPFVIVRDADGALVRAEPFVRRDSPNANALIEAIVATPTGELFVAGWFFGSVVFGDGPSAIAASAPGFAQRLFLARLDAAGELLWLTTTDAPETTFATVRRIARLPSSGDVALLGELYYDRLTFAAGTPQERTLVPGSGDGSLFLARFDGAGAFGWAKLVGVEGGADYTVPPRGLVVASDGGLLVADAVETDHAPLEVVIDPEGASPELLLVPADSVNLVLAKFAADGELVWARMDGGAGGAAYAMDVAARADGVFTVLAAALEDVVLGVGGPNEIPAPLGDRVVLGSYGPDGELLPRSDRSGDE